MLKIGLLGGMSWESTAEYYRLINQMVLDRLGGVHSARILLSSVDFAEIEHLQHQGDWQHLADILTYEARMLQQAGADFLVICTNTMHLLVPQIEQQITIPILHIADPTGAAIKAAGYHRVGLLGTAFTMEKDFYKQRLKDKFGLEVIIPDQADRTIVHDIIYHELVIGKVTQISRNAYRDVIAKLVAQGAQAIILGCTEIMLLVDETLSPVPLFDTTTLHAKSAVQRALSPELNTINH